MNNVFAVLLAGGKGTRFKAQNHNKTTALFCDKPLIHYGVKLVENVAEQIYVVVGAHANSVRTALKDFGEVKYAMQRKRMGTGHALLVAIREIEKEKVKPDYIVIGCGDHMMFYSKEIIMSLIGKATSDHSAIVMITSIFDRPYGLGRIKRDINNNIIGIIEEKDVSSKDKEIKEINAGLYCMEYNFLKKYIKKIKKSLVSKEYYLTDLVGIAVKNKFKINSITVPYQSVGIGVNSRDELEKSVYLYSQTERFIDENSNCR